MIISCPNCATRYDVDDRRFSPEGRSVRCAECEESWFVPAPQPIEDLVPLKKHQRAQEYEAPRRNQDAERTPDRTSASRWRDDVNEEDVEEPLFDPAPPRAEAKRSARDIDEDDARDREYSREDARERENAKSQIEPPPLMRDKKGRFIKVKKTESYADAGKDGARDRRPAKEERRFGRANRAEDGSRDDSHYDDREEDRHDARRTRWGGEADRRDRSDRDSSERDDFGASRDLRGASRGSAKGPSIVDADFEDIDAPTRPDYYDDPLARGFGRKAREERRRETALARMEDLEPVAERIFNDEFFTALRVQPKELERAIRKARRRAEAREKNRMTPMRAVGWSAWIGAIAACAFVTYSYRNNIVAMFPNAKTAYDAVGIEANPYGLKIEGVTHRVAMSPQGPVIEILGRLRNEETGDVAPPMLQAEALNAAGEILSRWTFSARAEKIRAGAFADFSTRAPAPDGVAEVLLSFAPADGVKLSVDQILKAPQN